MSTKTKVFRQGDVVLIPVSKLPQKIVATKRQHNRLILAEGEATGHAHAISDENATLWMGEDGKMFLSATKDVALQHEEHGTIHVPAGLFEVRRQREYVPKDVPQKVKD